MRNIAALIAAAVLIFAVTAAGPTAGTLAPAAYRLLLQVTVLFSCTAAMPFLPVVCQPFLCTVHLI